MKHLKKQFFAALFFAASLTTFAQVGIGTPSPSATLEVVGDPANASSLDGIIPPRLTGDQLRAKNYTTAQTGVMVYVTAADTAPTGQTSSVTSTGYYSFNGTAWTPVFDSTPEAPAFNVVTSDARTYNVQPTDDLLILGDGGSDFSNEEFFIQLPSVADSESANIPIGKMFYFHNTTRTFMRFNNLDFFPNLGGGAGDDFRRNYIPQFKGFTIMYVGEGRYASVSNH